MDGSKSGWFSAQELAYMEDPESVNSNHRSTVRDRIETKVNEKAVHDLDRLLDVTDFLDSSTRETLRLQSDPVRVGKGLGEMFPGQVSELVYGLLLSKREQDESADEFVKRFDSVWQEVEAGVRQRIQSAQLSFDARRSFRRFWADLLEKTANHVRLAHALYDVKMRIPVDDFVEWTVAQKGTGQFDHLPELFDIAYGITTDEPIPRRISDYWGMLSEAADNQGVEPPNGESWDVDFANPSEGDREQHEAALAALDEELRSASEQFWNEFQIIEQDQLLALGLCTNLQLQPRDKQILERVPCSNAAEGWSRYDTRRANVLADNRDIPVLSCETTPKQGTDEKHYEFTEYGRFVHWLAEYVEQKNSLSAVLRDFAKDVPEELVQEANDWVTENIEAARRLNMDQQSLKQLSDGESSDDLGAVLANSVLWARVSEHTDEAEWGDD
jgi:hypothetical protein